MSDFDRSYHDPFRGYDQWLTTPPEEWDFPEDILCPGCGSGDISEEDSSNYPEITFSCNDCGTRFLVTVPEE